MMRVSVAGLILVHAFPAAAQAPDAELWRQVEIIRTAHGVPHIRAESLRAAGYALGWLQLEDYGPRAALMALRARGEMAKVFGRDSIESDFENRRNRSRAVATYPRLEQATRDVYDGFAAGMNRYIALHAEEFPPGMPANFTGYDVAARDMGGGPAVGSRFDRFVARLNPQSRRDTARQSDGEGDVGNADVIGSNAWAFAPSRTKSGKAILLRNPHLQWTAGYYEAHITVPQVIDFYGDFRIGGPFSQVGGFNRFLGFATTNSQVDLDEFYALDVDPAKTDHYLFDGASIPVTRELITVEFKNGDGLGTESRELLSTRLGPVIYRGKGKIYIAKAATEGEFRAGEQMLHMMRATSLAQWKDAMRLRARPTSNFTYADRAGNIFYLWNASLPLLPHPPGGDTVAVPARGMRDVWTRYVPFDSLTQVLNPKGGYIHNENASPHFTNIRGRIDTTNAYPNFEKPRLSLRSQLGLELISGDNKVSLEDVIRMKHNYKMLLADRVKPDLIAAVKATNPAGDVASALARLEKWNNTGAPESRGSTLFEVWWQRYSSRPGSNAQERRVPDSLLFSTVWTAAQPTTTPRGLADPTRAAASFAWAVAETTRLYGSWDKEWGEVHRVRQGNIDVPVGGCPGDLGCFRVLGFTRAPDGKLVASGGDGWVLAVEFADVPRAYSVLAYGESAKPESPWHASQAGMFAKGEMKKVAFTARDVDASAVARYRPGEKR
ncbi:MAG: penicillin acylase family protein [Gemmatimonadota bacterium]|nr:penicillin acylase family protein [Gemmatimonadota bacterium]